MIFGHSYNPYLFPSLVDFSQPSFWIAVASICFNPLYWNIVAQNEYRNKSITKILGGRTYLGCYCLGASIFLLGILRDHLYNKALSEQPVNANLLHPVVKYLGGALFAAGNVFVLSSMWALGVTGTYLGDYFGILMKEMVTGFPFNVMGDPMYWGSSMCFIGVSLWFAKPSGLILSALVIIVYSIALRYEGPYTSNIYAKAAKESKRSEQVAKLQETSGPARGTRSHTPTSPARKTKIRSKKSS